MQQKFLSYADLEKKDCSDSALAFLFLVVLISKFTALIPSDQAIDILGIGLIISMLVPSVFKPFAWFWLNLSVVLGKVMSKIVLSLLFYGFIFPIGILVRLLTKDPIKMKEWKKSGSVYVDRDFIVSKEAVIKPY